MRFSKMHGLGNDFILVPHGQEIKTDADALARHLCDRRRGIGADGLVLLAPAPAADLAMHIFNPDGSEAEQCGNALRCVAAYAYERLGLRHESLQIATRSGIKTAELQFADGHVVAVRVNMGRPSFDATAISAAATVNQAPATMLELAGCSIEVHPVRIGVPHAISFVADVRAVPLESLGPQIEKHPFFPHNTNVEFVQVRDDGDLDMRVWERSVGVTLACGSGACASLVAAARSGRSSRAAMVHMPGGSLHIEWAADDQLFMRGPASFVFDGDINPEQIVAASW